MTDQTSASSTSRWPNPMLRTRGRLAGQEILKKKPRLPTNRFGNFEIPHTWWGLQLLVLAISLIAFWGLVAVLFRFDGHPPQVLAHPFGDPDASWLAFSLTLNGLVALVATITRVALMANLAAALSQSKWVWFSKSSRKPGNSRKLGDLEIFDQASRGQWGSLIFLWKMKCKNLACIGAALTILTLRFDVFAQQILSLEDRLEPDATAIASVPRSEFYSSGSNGPMHTSWNPDPLMKASILTGITTDDIQDLPVYCSNGNCTWPTIPTLAVCGACTDVTANVSRIKNETNYGYYTFTLPDGFSWTSPVEETYLAEMMEVFVSYQKYPDIERDVLGETDQPLYIATFDTIGLPRRTGSMTAQTIDDVRATECALWWCLQAYRITVNSTQQLQTIVQTWSQRTHDGHRDGIAFRNIPPEFNVLPGTTYGVSRFALRGINAGFSELFRGTVWGTRRTGYEYRPDMIQFIWSGSQDMNKFINNIALSMTNGLRTQAPADSATHSHYLGTAYSMQTYTCVRWAWIAFPAATVIGSLFFLLAIMWQSRRRGVHGWRDSALALLFSSVSAKLIEKGKGGLDQPDELLNLVGDEEVILREYDDQWHFDEPAPEV